MPNQSYKPKEAPVRTSLGSGAPPALSSDTVPDLDLPARLAAPKDTLPEQAGVYVAPRPLASPTEHRTMEIAAVRLADYVDPRRAATELRLSAPPARRAPYRWLLGLAAVLALAFAVFAYLSTREVESPAFAPQRSPLREPPKPAPELAAARPTAVPASREPTAAAAAPTPSPVAAPATPPVTSTPSARASADRPRKKARNPWLE